LNLIPKHWLSVIEPALHSNFLVQGGQNFYSCLHIPGCVSWLLETTLPQLVLNFHRSYFETNATGYIESLHTVSVYFVILFIVCKVFCINENSKPLFAKTVFGI